MSEINQSREKNIYNITCIVKLISLLFSSIILYNYLSQNNCANKNSYNNTVFAILLSLIMTVIYLIWSFFTVKIKMFKNILFIQKYIIYTKNRKHIFYFNFYNLGYNVRKV